MEITFSLFPKFYRNLDVKRLAALIHNIKLDTADVIIRNGYWVTPEKIRQELPVFIADMLCNGVTVKSAITDYVPVELAADSTPLAVMADNGIGEFRLGIENFHETHSGRNKPGNPFIAARKELEQLVYLCQKYKIRAILQLHHKTLLASASAAWHLVHGLPREAAGIWIDPGNQSFEGYEEWDRTAFLLGDYIRTVGVKDTLVYRDIDGASEPDKGWRRIWSPVYEGVTDWYELVRALASIDFRGTFVFMPFYDTENQKKMTSGLKKEIAYIKKIVSSFKES